jgi:hypothetical protein
VPAIFACSDPNTDRIHTRGNQAGDVVCCVSSVLQHSLWWHSYESAAREESYQPRVCWLEASNTNHELCHNTDDVTLACWLQVSGNINHEPCHTLMTSHSHAGFKSAATSTMNPVTILMTSHSHAGRMSAIVRSGSILECTFISKD